MAIGLVLLALMLILLLWPRDDRPRQPDAIVVLGGGGPERAELGIALQAEYDADLVLFAYARMFAERLGVECGPRIICLEPDPWSTIGEALVTRAVMAERDWQHVTVVTNRFHATRARVLFQQCLGHRVSVVRAEDPYDGRNIHAGTYRHEALGILAAWTLRRAC